MTGQLVRMNPNGHRQGQAPVAPARWLGWQKRPGRPAVELWNLVEAIPGHPVGSTVARETVEAAGYYLPDPPDPRPNPCHSRRNPPRPRTEGRPGIPPGWDELTTNERQLILKLTRSTWWPFAIERRSQREFDVEVRGFYRWSVDAPPITFQAWLPLHAIRELTQWTSPDVAALTDYPEMALSGDWSAVRDTDPRKLWAIFILFVQPKIWPEQRRFRPGLNPREPGNYVEAQYLSEGGKEWLRKQLEAYGGDVERLARYLRDVLRIGPIRTCRAMIREAAGLPGGSATAKVPRRKVCGEETSPAFHPSYGPDIQKMADTWGAAWNDLSDDEKLIILQDFRAARAEDGIGSLEYHRRIGAGNLRSYVDTLKAGIAYRQRTHRNAPDDPDDGARDGEPQEEDYLMSDARGGGVIFGIAGGGSLGKFADRDEAERFIVDRMQTERFWPSVWFISDHGNAHVVTDLPRPRRKRTGSKTWEKTEGRDRQGRFKRNPPASRVLIYPRGRIRGTWYGQHRNGKHYKHRFGAGVKAVFGLPDGSIVIEPHRGRLWEMR